MPETVPFLDLPAQHRPLLPELERAFKKAAESAAFIGGAAVADFEGAFAKFCGAKSCVGVANGTDALILALKVLGVGPGDVVVVPAYTFIATAEAPSYLGATPRFVDVDPVTFTLSPRALDTVDAKGVKAVMPVHLYGQPADMDPIAAICKQRGWHIVEDAAQAHGATYKGKPIGRHGALTGFSFYPGKNLGALGDAGAVIGDDAELCARIRRLADHGRISKYEHGEPGINSRLDAIQAAALSVKLGRLPDWNAGRARVASWYDARFAGVKGLETPKVGSERTHVWHLYVIQVADRERLRDSLGAAGIQSGVHYPVPLHLQPAYRHLGYAKGAFPVSEKVSERCLSIPMFPEMTEAQVDRVAKHVIGHVRAGG